MALLAYELLFFYLMPILTAWFRKCSLWIARFLPLTWTWKLISRNPWLSHYYLPATERRIIQQNLLNGLGDKRKNSNASLAAKTYQEIFSFACEYAYLARCAPHATQTWAKQTNIVGTEHLKSILDQPRGAIALSIHMAGFLLSFLALAELGRTLSNTRKIVILKQADPSKQEEKSYRHFQFHHTLTILRTKDHPAKALLSALHNGNIILSYLDIPPTGGTGSRAIFLEKPAQFSNTLFKLAYRTGSPILPLLTIRETFPRQTLIIHPPITPASQENETRFVSRGIQQFADFASTAIFTYPEQWQHWGHLHQFLNTGEKPHGKR